MPAEAHPLIGILTVGVLVWLFWRIGVVRWMLKLVLRLGFAGLPVMVLLAGLMAYGWFG